MRKCAVIIGVNKTGTLPILVAAADGAREFKSWADLENFDSTLLTDDNGTSVTVKDIRNAIAKYVNAQIYGQIVVFFSGHGMLLSPQNELWLLSDAPNDSNEAVNMTLSMSHARNCGIPHIIFVSDACRSIPHNIQYNQMSGGNIFPNKAPCSPVPHLDVFYATLAGDPALEVPASQSTKNYKGLFTEILLKCLRGDVSSVIEDFGNGHHPRWVVPSWTLESYLEKEVPLAAQAIHLKYNQDPDIRAESRKPEFFSATKPPISLGGPPEGVGHATSMTKRQTAETLMKERISKVMKVDPGLPPNAKDIAKDSSLSKTMDTIISTKGREKFETETGFSIIGAHTIQAYLTRTHADVFRENDAIQVRVHRQINDWEHQSILLAIDNSIAVPLAVLPGYIGTVVVVDGRIINVNYTPNIFSDKYSDYQHEADEIERRRAFAAAASLEGVFRLDDSNKAVLGADYLRQMKSTDPTLGLYAAYAYAQVGNMNEVNSVYDYMSREMGPNNVQVPVLFDVALLAGKLNFKNNLVSPFCPMLVQGWSYMEDPKSILHQSVVDARKHLIPGLWTTFNLDGSEIIRKAIKSGELK